MQCLRTDSLESIGDVSSSLANTPYMPVSNDPTNMLNTATLHHHPCNNSNNNGSGSYTGSQQQQQLPNSHTSGGINGVPGSLQTATNNNQMHANLHPANQHTHTSLPPPTQQSDMMTNLQHIKQDYDLTTL